MKTSENRYKRGKIYKIISNQTNDVYYGSTVEPYLTNRLSGHRKCYKCWLNGKCNYTSSYEIVKFEDAKIILVETFPCDTKDQLLAREQYHIDNNDCVNKYKSWHGLSQKEYDKQRHKHYYKENREKVIEQHKNYYDNHKEQIKQYHQLFILQNAEKLSEQKKQYRIENAEKISEQKKEYRKRVEERLKSKIICECGSTLRKIDIRRHERTKKHQQFISNQIVEK